MRLHTNAHAGNLSFAATAARVAIVRGDEKGSRSHERAYDVQLTGHSARAVNAGTARYANRGAAAERAATWDQWGIFLGSLYAVDPAMLVGSKSHPIYENAEHFHWTTSGRFDRWDWEESKEHLQHHWEYQGRSVSGLYVVHNCKGSKSFGECFAQTRRLTSMSWTDFKKMTEPNYDFDGTI